MPAARGARLNTGRKGPANIPNGFILNWQSSQNKSTKPLVRRPMTACDNCRTAKVKCNNDHPKCERYTSRGLSCKYNAIDPDTWSVSGSEDTNLTQRTQRPHRQPQAIPATTSTSTDPSMIPDTLLTSSDNPINDIPMDLNLEMFNELHQDDFLSMGASENVIEWSYELGEQLNQSHIEAEDPSSALSTGSTATDPNVSLTRNSGLLYTRTQREPQIMQAFQSLGGNCQCRGLLLTQVPRVRNVLQQPPEPKLGDVFKVTQEVIQICQNLIDCTHCQLNWSDVLCIVAVFQSTQACFKRLAKADADNMIKVSIDDNEISLSNSTTLRHLLVTDLLKRASDFLTSLKMLGANVMKKELPLGSLCRINLQFLNSAIGDCEAILQCVNRSVDSSNDGSQSGSSSLIDGEC